MESEEEREWRMLTTDGEITQERFFKNAKRKESAFHDKYVWDVKQAAYDYWMRRSAQLISYYSGKFNVNIPSERLHPVPQHGPKKLRSTRPFKTWEKMSTEEQAAVEAWYWVQWRNLARKCEGLPAFRELLSDVGKHIRVPEAMATR